MLAADHRARHAPCRAWPAPGPLAAEANVIWRIENMGKHPTYDKDNEFKARARFHQSEFREKALGLDEFDVYGNRLCENDGVMLCNYFDGLEVRSFLRDKYPNYSKLRDADMLRSEHIPFNLFAPLMNRHSIALKILDSAFGIEVESLSRIEIEWPGSKANPLGDHTAFDTYIEGLNAKGKKVGVGIEVKYTEEAYRIGKSEKVRIEDPDSSYWRTTSNSGYFLKDGYSNLSKDKFRQIWRNQILGLAMVHAGEIDDFYSITIYPKGNEHFGKTLPKYQELLVPSYRDRLLGCTFEDFFDSIPTETELGDWINYLRKRYLVTSPI